MMLSAVLVCMLASVLAAAELPVVDLPAHWNPPTGGTGERTATRERLCLNGAWRFLAVPSTAKGPGDPAAVRSSGLFFQVPCPWPTARPDGQVLFRLGAAPVSMPDSFDQAWYHRPLVVPPDWSGRRILLDLRYLQSLATVWVDGREAGRMVFPGGMLDLTGRLRPGGAHELTLLVAARRLGGSGLRFMAADEVVVEAGHLAQRGLCGDAWLVAEPMAAAVRRVSIATNIDPGGIAVEAQVSLAEPGGWRLRCEVIDGTDTVLEFAGDESALSAGDHRLRAASSWRTARRWDAHTPGHRYRLRATLVDAAGHAIDRFHEQEFGVREVRVAGRDLLLNGVPLRLRMMPLDPPAGHHAAGSFAWPSREGMRAELQSLRRLGVNCVYSHNYGFAPGDAVSYADILRLCDEEGMLVIFAMPHAKDYAWDGAVGDPGADNGYERLVDWLLGEVANHPSVVLYAMNHNSTGYDDDQNPLQVGGAFVPPLEKRHRGALAAEAIVNRLDPTRPTFHHSSGGIGRIYTLNCYLNWAPAQERADWFSTWARSGTKPLLLVEWGGPLMLSWSSYRGPAISSQPHVQQAWLAEYAAPVLGDAAYDPAPAEIAALREEAAAGEALQPIRAGILLDRCRDMPTVTEVTAHFLREYWPAMRTWGVTGTNLWWARQTGWDPPTGPAAGFSATAALAALAVADRPGLHPCLPGRPRQDCDPARANVLGRTFAELNQPCLLWLAGPPGDFTARARNLHPDQPLERQVVAVNDSRIAQRAEFGWRLEDASGTLLHQGAGTLLAPPGGHASATISLQPGALIPGRYRLVVDGRMDGRERRDEAEVVVMARPTGPRTPPVLLYDPQGGTSALFRRLGIAFEPVGADARPGPGAVVVIGRQALTSAGDLPFVASAGQVLVLEQDETALTARCGFRTQRLGLRSATIRSPGHPALGGIDDSMLRDWRGEATLIPPFTVNRHHASYPVEDWNGHRNPRVWRAGNRGSVASVLIEKPTAAGWRALIDGGFDTQYAPLLEWRGAGRRVVFCQLDVTARTAEEPAADHLVCGLISYLASNATTPPGGRLLAAVSARADSYLRRLGFDPVPLPGSVPAAGDVALIEAGMGVDAVALRHAGVAVLAVGCDAGALAKMGVAATIVPGEYLGRRFTSTEAAFLGVGSALVHLRRPWRGPLLEGAAHPLLGRADDGTVLLQVAPWDWDDPAALHLRRSRLNLGRLLSTLLGNLGCAVRGPDPVAWLSAPPRTGEEPIRLDSILGALWLEEILPEDRPGSGLLPELSPLAAPEGGLPLGWSGEASVVRDGDARVLRIANRTPGTSVAALRHIEVPQGVDRVRLSLRWRAQGVVCGKAGWHTPRMIASFRDVAGRTLGEDSVEVRRDCSWTTIERTWQVPAGTVTCQLRVGLFSAVGSLDLAEVRLLPGSVPQRREHLLPSVWNGLALHGRNPPPGWDRSGFDDRKWLRLEVPGKFESQHAELEGYDGQMLYRVVFDAPSWAVQGGARLMLGAIDDEDETRINGQMVGMTGRRDDPRSFMLPRRYAIAPGTFQGREDTIGIVVTDLGMDGGLRGWRGLPPCDLGQREKKVRSGTPMRSLAGLYIDIPLAEDDPYRYYRW